MPKTRAFDEYSTRYEDWFERNKWIYESELQAIKMQLPGSGVGIEVGVGTGRFASPLGIKIGVEPSVKMREIASQKAIEVIDGVAESLPIKNAILDFALMVTTVCFLDDIQTAFKEVHRIIKPGGLFIIGFIDKSSLIGLMYQQHKKESVFYYEADFYSVAEIISELNRAGFGNHKFYQTIFHDLRKINNIEPIKPGYGEGSFVVVKSVKQ